MNILDSFMNYLNPAGSSSPAQFGTTAYSNTAPTDWQTQMMNSPGFSSVGSGGLNLPGASKPTFMQGALGYEGANGYVPGWGGMALGAASGIGQSLMAMKQFGLAEDQLKEGKRQFDINYGMQKKSFNSQLEDRQRARVAANPGAYQSVGEVMNKYGA